jgi:hypothetical protein
MTAPLSPEHTWLILEAGRKLDDVARDNFFDFIAHEISTSLDPCTEDVERAIATARKALRLSEAH